MLGENVSLGQALGVTVFSMAIVFITLIIISFMLTAFKHIFKEGNKSEAKVAPKKVKVAEPVVETKDDSDDEELIAVITAAIAASLSVPTTDIKIKNIKRVSQNASPWSRMGRIEQMNS